MESQNLDMVQNFVLTKRNVGLSPVEIARVIELIGFEIEIKRNAVDGVQRAMTVIQTLPHTIIPEELEEIENEFDLSE